MFKRMILFLYIAITMGLLVMGFLFEEPFSARRYILMVLCAIYMLIGVFKVIYHRGSHVTIICLASMVMILLGMEFYSKYAVNYFFHTFYVVLILFTIMHIQTKHAVIVSVIMTILSFVKFIELIVVAPTFANISLMVFFGSFQILIVVVGVFLRVYQDESRKTKQLYEELLGTHDQLKAYSKEIKELSQIEARTMIARDLHDTLGHDITGLIMQMEMASGYYQDGDSVLGNQFLERSKQSARDSLVQVREIVETLKKTNDSSTINDSISDLIENFSHKTGCKIQFSEKGSSDLKPEVNLVLYRVIQESMTNAVRHGHARLIYISLIYQASEVVFVIEDNGRGCEKIEPGNGLSGMRERLEMVGGSVEVSSNSGFMVKGRIPYEGNHSR